MSAPNVQAAVAINLAGGSSIVLIAAAANVNGLILKSGSITSSIAVTGAPGAAMDSTDVLQDSTGAPILACQIQCTNAAGALALQSVSQELHGMVIPAGRSVSLVNGVGTPGYVHKCSGTLIYIAL